MNFKAAIEIFVKTVILSAIAIGAIFIGTYLAGGNVWGGMIALAIVFFLVIADGTVS